MPRIAMPSRRRALKLLALLCTVLSAAWLYQPVKERCLDAWSDLQWRIEQEAHRQVDFIVGFYVGPSYCAAVALFRNGTTLKLAKVDGDANYQAAMERRIARADAVQAWFDSSEPVPDGDGTFGRSTPEVFETVFMPTLRTLKERSESILQQRIEHVHFATPWIADYRSPFYDEKDTFVVARRRLGLKKPFTFQALTLAVMPMHVNEANAVLAASGRKLCEECACVAWLWPQTSGYGSNVFYVNLSNKSLFLSLQRGSCVFEAYNVLQLQLDTAYGLDKLASQDPIEYWEGVNRRIMAFIEPWYQKNRDYVTAILIAGEATTNPDLLAMLQSVQQKLLELPRKASSKLHDAYDYQHIEGTESIELIVAEDGVFDAAKGAVMWMRTNFWGFCDGTDRETMDIVCHEHYERNGVEWRRYSPPWYSHDEVQHLL